MNASADNAASDQHMRRLTDAQLKELMRLIKGANSVELKLTVPALAHRATIQGLPMDPVEAQPRQIFFFDTPDLQLYRAGVVVRARRIAGGKGDTVVKLRPVDPADIPADLRNDPAFNVEVDALPGGFVCSASFKGRSDGQSVRDAVSGKKRISKIFSKAQRAFYRLNAPPGVDMDSLVPLGPTFVLKGRFDTGMGLDGKTRRSMVAEVWLYPDGSRILELSTKCMPSEALSVATETRAYLVDKGVPTNAAQETKTLTALQFYSSTLQADLAAGEAQRRAKQRPAARASRAAAKPAPKSGTKSGTKSAAKPAAKATAKSPAKPPAKAATKPAAAKATTTRRSTARAAAAKPAARTTTRRAAPRRTPPKAS